MPGIVGFPGLQGHEGPPGPMGPKVQYFTIPQYTLFHVAL